MSAIEEFSSNEQPIRPERFVSDLTNVLPSNALVALIVLTNSSFRGIKAERVADPAFLARYIRESWICHGTGKRPIFDAWIPVNILMGEH